MVIILTDYVDNGDHSYRENLVQNFSKEVTSDNFLLTGTITQITVNKMTNIKQNPGLSKTTVLS